MDVHPFCNTRLATRLLDQPCSIDDFFHLQAGVIREIGLRHDLGGTPEAMSTPEVKRSYRGLNLDLWKLREQVGAAKIGQAYEARTRVDQVFKPYEPVFELRSGEPVEVTHAAIFSKLGLRAG